jgi:catechol 2,3-dioxygenase-like lactoylglutathione lyase family enzyme
MSAQLTYVIKYVADMNKAVAFYRDAVGLNLKFQSPEWSEFVTGPTTLALHIASTKNPAGTAHIGFGVPDIARFHDELSKKGVQFPRLPKKEHGHTLATFLDVDNSEVSVSGP